MNRYKSSQKWRKVEAGVYESPDGNSRADKEGDGWVLTRFYSDRNPAYTGWAQQGTFLTLADCQEHAEKLEARDASV